MPYELLINDLDKAASSLRKTEKLRKYMEDVVLHNEQCYDLIINNSGDGIIIQSAGRIIFANSTTVNFLGALEVNHLIGKSIWDFIHEDSIEMVKQRSKKILNEKINLPFDNLKFVSLDGKVYNSEGSSSYIIYRGKPAFLTIIKNIRSQEKITSLKNTILENEKKLFITNEYNKVLTAFFTNISHELRTPLNVILGSVQLLMQQSDNYLIKDAEKPKMVLDIMKQNTYRLIRLVNNLIDITKYDSGYLKLEKHNYNIVSIIEDITYSVRQCFIHKGINIIFDTDTEEKIMAVDKEKIEKVILNLLSNAVKFTKQGGEISVTIQDRDDKVRITVKDTGIGIPEDEIDNVFDRFAQVDKSFTRDREGSGIGLSIVKVITEMHEGTVYVKSKLGEGSEFIVELPVNIIEENEIIQEYAVLNYSKEERIKIEFSDIYNCE